jgi:superfamily II DNA or RNA helicase
MPGIKNMMSTARSLRTYQQESWDAARSNFAKGFRSILIQSPTGTGKTRMVAHGVNTAISRTAPGTNRKQRVWFIVPRKELLWQSSAELKEWKIQHGMISAKSKESNAFNVHVVSRDTLIRLVRKNKIKNWPELMIFDEAHVALKQQLEIKAAAPPGTIILGVTATPERLDNTPLLGMYDVAVFGHQMQWFVENKFLKRPWVLSIPGKDRLAGLDKLKTNAAGDVNANALMELYKERAQGNKVLYGNEIKHYEKHGTGRSFLVFCRNLDQAKEVAAEFTNAGISCEEIDGTMTDKVRREKIKRVESGVIMGLTTVDLCTYGLDVPRISCLILLRLTDSVALFFQMIGRGLRWDGKYENCLILDHVGNCDDTKHGHPLLERTWNFEGKEKKKKLPKEAVGKIEAVGKCKICFDHIVDGICRGCGAEVEKVERGALKEIDGWLVEIKEPTPLRERPIENQRHYEDMINNNVDVFRAKWQQDGVIDVQAVTNLIQVSSELKRAPMWVYHKLTEGDTMVNVSLLSAIQLIDIPGVKKRYNNGWLYMKRKELERYKAS